MRLIDADELIDLIKERNCGFCRDNDNRHNNWHCRECEYNEVMSNIEDAPTIEQKHGRWIVVDAAREKCSECKTVYSIDSLFALGINDEPRFCPNCGSPMDELGDNILEAWNLDGSPTRYIKGARMDEVE